MDIRYFSSSLKLRHCRTIVLLDKLKLKKKLFLVVMRFPAKKNAGSSKTPRNFPPRKDDILLLPLGCLGTPFPLPQSLYGCTGGRTLTSESKFLGLIGYQISLPNVLCPAAFGCKGAPLKSVRSKLSLRPLS